MSQGERKETLFETSLKSQDDFCIKYKTFKDDDNGDEKESDDNALSITQGKCHPANMQRLCTFSPADPYYMHKMN